MTEHLPPPAPLPSERPVRRMDEVTGFWPGVQLAVGLAAVTGTVTAGVFVAWVRLAGKAGLFEGATDPVAATGWWVAFWLVLSAGLLGGLWAGYRSWLALYPVSRRYTRARAALREEREAVVAAQSLLDEARRTSVHDD